MNPTMLLPDQPGWIADPASLSEAERGRRLSRIYSRGRARLSVRVTARSYAATVAATTMNFPDFTDERGSRTWTERGCKAHLVVAGRGGLHSLSVILRGGPGDLHSSVWLEITGQHAKPGDALDLALALD